MPCEAQKGRRCAEVCTIWRSGVVLNWQEKHKKVGDIEEVNEGARKNLREPGRIFKVIKVS